MAEILFGIFGVIFVMLTLYLMALNDIVIGICPQGQIKLITKSGVAHRLIHAVAGKRAVFSPLIQDFDLVDGEEVRGWFFDRTGIFWIGLWPIYRVDNYPFEWNSIKIGDDGKEIIKHRREIVNSQYWRFEYPLVFRSMETSDNFRTKVVVQVIAEIVRPLRARYYAKVWLNVLSAAMESKVRDFVGSASFEELRGQKTENVIVQRQGFVQRVMELNLTDNTDANPGLVDSIGVTIYAVNFKSIDAEDQRIVEALEAEAVAERQGRAAVITAKKKAKARRIEAAAERDYLDATELHIADNPDAVEAYKARHYSGKDSKLTHLFEKGAVNVNLGGNQNPPTTLPPNRR